MKLKEVLDPEMEIGSPEILDLRRDREQVYLICYDPKVVNKNQAGELADRLWRAGVVTLWAPIKGGVQALGLKKDVPNKEESERVREYELRLSELLNSGATNGQIERWFVDVMRMEINRVVSNERGMSYPPPKTRVPVDIEASITGHMVGIVEQLNQIKPRYSIGPVCDLIRQILWEEILKQ